MKFRNGLAAGVIGGLLIIACLQGRGIIQISEFIQGVLYGTGFVLVIQFYFRRREEPPP